MLVDNVTLQIKAGDGGNGASTFLRNGLTAKGGPDGGNGGNGGNVYFQGSGNTRDLRQFRFQKKITAASGIRGKSQKLYGKNAPDTTIVVPLGTKITDTESGKAVEVTDTTTLHLLAKGGKGGRGNYEFRSATRQAPTYAERGTLGEVKNLFLELRLIAEIGLIGLPNAGKSSLLAVLTNATPKIGNFPFTTLQPNIGMMGVHALADIPGLIEGASKGRGLGVTFLKHIEKTKLLLHCIDATDENAVATYKTVRLEFAQYNKALLEKPEVVLLTKTDLAEEKAIKNTIKVFEKKGLQVMTCSIYDDVSIKILTGKLEKILSSA